MSEKGFRAVCAKALSDIDPKNPYHLPFSGLIDVGKGAYAYVPEALELSCWSLTIVPPRGVCPKSFLVDSGWKDLADSQKVLLLIANNEDGENDSVLENALSYLDGLVGSKEYFDAQRFFAYLIGYEDGAAAALRYILKHPASYAGVAFAGLEHQEVALGEIGAEKNAASGEIAVPALFMTGCEDPIQPAVAEFVRRNGCLAEPFSFMGDTVYLPNPVETGDEVSSQRVADVIVRATGSHGKVDAASTWETLHRSIRVSGVGVDDLHPYRTTDEWGLVRHELEIDGVVRHWLEYVPKGNVSRCDSRPLLVFLHGGSQTAKSAVYAAEWMNVAEARDFIVAFPTGTMRPFDNQPAHPAWNATRASNLFNDELFIREMVEDVCARENVDRGRVYVVGHSMGAAMAQRCALALPDVFAAAASNSGVVVGGFMGDFDTPGVREDLAMPVFIQMGEHDVGGSTFAENRNAERTVEYWIKRGSLSSLDDALVSKTGRYSLRQWVTKEGVPMLSYMRTLDKPHCITPQDAWIYYDWFLSRFSRRADGTTEYMGRAV